MGARLAYYHAAVRAMSGGRHAAHPSRIRCPVLLAWGMRDPVATPAVLAGLRELRPEAPVTELRDLGHYPQIEDPAAVADAIRRTA